MKEITWLIFDLQLSKGEESSRPGHGVTRARVDPDTVTRPQTTALLQLQRMSGKREQGEVSCCCPNAGRMRVILQREAGEVGACCTAALPDEHSLFCTPKLRVVCALPQLKWAASRHSTSSPFWICNWQHWSRCKKVAQHSTSAGGTQQLGAEGEVSWMRRNGNEGATSSGIHPNCTSHRSSTSHPDGIHGRLMARKGVAGMMRAAYANEACGVARGSGAAGSVQRRTYGCPARCVVHSSTRRSSQAKASTSGGAAVATTSGSGSDASTDR